jgi:hypothetical protein
LKQLRKTTVSAIASISQAPASIKAILPPISARQIQHFNSLSAVNPPDHPGA